RFCSRAALPAPRLHVARNLMPPNRSKQNRPPMWGRFFYGGTHKRVKLRIDSAERGASATQIEAQTMTGGKTGCQRITRTTTKAVRSDERQPGVRGLALIEQIQPALMANHVLRNCLGPDCDPLISGLAESAQQLGQFVPDE